MKIRKPDLLPDETPMEAVRRLQLEQTRELLDAGFTRFDSDTFIAPNPMTPEALRLTTELLAEDGWRDYEPSGKSIGEVVLQGFRDEPLD